MALTRAFNSGGSSNASIAGAGDISLSSIILAFSKAVSKVLSVSRFLRCAISAIARRSGSREVDVREGL
jgi:hypothetical protein